MRSSVSFNDCLTELVEPHPEAGRAYEKWLGDKTKVPVHDFVRKFRHRHLFAVTLDEVGKVIGRSRADHALGNVDASEQVDEVENFNTPWALQYLFHRCLEEEKRVPGWSEFRAWLLGPARPDYMHPFMEKFGITTLTPNRGTKAHELLRALRWRVGKAYYSAIREMHLLTALREVHGLPMKYHLFADVVLKCDMWIAGAAVAAYIGNPAYRDGAAGRKYSLRNVLSGSRSFKVLEVRLPNERKYGRVWIVSDAEIRNLADQIRKLRAGAARPVGR